MSFVARAASFAALTLCAVALAGVTPGSAQEIHGQALVPLNALMSPQVPAAPEPRAAPQPAVLQTIQDIPEPTAVASADETDFASLADAVAAQDGDLSNAEVRCLAAGVYYEAKGEPLTGQLAVAQTILNRTRSGRFPKSVCSVLTQRGQFSFVRGGVVPSAEGRNGWSTAVAVAKVAHADLWDGAADEALYFHARRVAPGWRMQRVAAIGNHVFYR